MSRIAFNAKPMKRVLFLLMAAAPFLLIGWYGLAALLIAATIRLTIRKDEYTADDCMAIVLWSLLSGCLLAFAGRLGYIQSAASLSLCIACMSWPAAADTVALEEDDGHLRIGGKIIIKDAEVIDI